LHLCCFIFLISLLGCHFSINNAELLNDFSELYQNYALIKIFYIQLIRFNFNAVIEFFIKRQPFFEDFNLTKKKGIKTQVFPACGYQ